MRRVLPILVLVWASTASAESRWDWNKTDVALQATWTAIHVLDWSQTREIAKKPVFHEHNIILGEHPSVSEVDRYMAVSLLANTAISAALPKPYRNYWQFLSIGASGYCVMINFKVGLGGGDWF